MRVLRRAAALAFVALLSACGGSGPNAGGAIPVPNAGGEGLTPSSFTPPKYTIVDLGVNVDPTALNATNTVVGYTSGEGKNPFYAFSYANGQMHNLGMLAGDTQSAALDINDAGTIVGYSAGDSGRRAVEFSTSGPFDLGSLNGSTLNTAYAVNNVGEIVGHAGIAGYIYTDPCDGPAVTFDGHGGVQQMQLVNAPSEDATPLAINDSGVVAGRVCTPSASNAAWLPFSNPPYQTLWPPTAVAGDCTFGRPSQSANDINTHGDVVGEYCDLSLGAGSFLLKNGAYTTVANTQFSAMNDADWVVGNVFQGSAILYVNGKTYDLKSLLTGTGCDAWTLLTATDINASNVIVGTGLVNGTEHGFMLLPQP